MRVQRLWCPALLALAAALTAGPGLGQQPKGDPKDKSALAKRADDFVAAFHKGDAKALAAFWAPDGEYTDQTGRHLKGRAAIEKAFKGFFAEHKGLKLRIDSDSLRFVTADVAIEEGTTAVLSTDGSPPSRARYTIVHVKKDGYWYLDSVRDAPFVPPSNAEHLRGLAWVIGDWSGKTDTGVVEQLTFAWTENQNFIVSSFTTTAKNVSVGGATLWTGWDPAAKRIRTWIFDATGGFSEGSWAPEGKGWALKTTGTHQDGTKTSATYVLTRIDANTIALRATDRSMGGKALPDTKEVKLTRTK